jgi:protein CpxP
MSARTAFDQFLSVTSSQGSRKWAWRAVAVAAGATVAVSLGAWAATTAKPAAAPVAASAPQAMGSEPGMGMGMGAAPEGHGPHGHHGMGRPGGEGGPEGMMPFGGHHLQRMLDDVKATDAQRTQIRTITDKAQADLKALHEEGRALHEQGLDLWAAPKLDAAAAEAQRQKMLHHHDQVSQRMMQAMLDVGQVLTPEQRATIVQRMRAHHQGMWDRMKARLGGTERHAPPAPAASAAAAAHAH